MRLLKAVATCALAGLSHTPLNAQRMLSAVKELTLDGDRHDLGSIGNVLVSGRGVIAIVERGVNRIRFFDAGGRALGLFGRTGEGPGEFQQLSWPGWHGDTLVVGDDATRRITFIGPDLKVLRLVPEAGELLPPLNAPGLPPGRGHLGFVGVLRDGSFLVVAQPEPRPPWFPANHQPDSDFLHVTRDWHFLGVAHRYRTDGVECGWGKPSVEIPFCFSASYGFLANVGAATVLPGKTANTFRVRVIEILTGDTLLNREYQYAPAAIPRRFSDSVRAASLARPNLPEPRRASLQAVPFPASFPAVTGVVVGIDGSIWLKDGNRLRPRQRWLVLDSKGNKVGTLDLPTNLDLAQTSLTAIWGIESDADGVQSVVRYRVR